MMNFLRKQMKWVMAIIVVAFLLSTFLMYEGRSTRHTPEINADGSMSDYEVAQVNGRSLMRSELERRLRDYLSSYSSRSAESLDMPAIYQAVLDQAVLESQLAKEVEESGIRVSDEEADRAMKYRADMYYPTRETFYQALANSGIRIEDYKKNLARQMAVEQLFSRAIGEVDISEDKAVEFYNTMKDLIYSKPEGFNVHAANFRKQEEAEVLRGKLLAGASWDVIVSNDELASNDLINITKEPVFLPSTALKTGTFSVLDSLDIGEVSPVFEVASFDFAVGLKTEHVEASVMPYEEVSGDIRTLLTQQEQRIRLANYETSLRNKANVVINDTSLFARETPTVSSDEPSSESIIEEITESSEDTKAESEPVVESRDESSHAEEVKAEETAPAVEPATTEEPVKEETKAEEPVSTDESAATEEPAPTVEPAATEETVKEEPKTEETATEPEVKTEEPVKEAEPVVEAVKVETVSEEVKTETPSEESEPEVKAEESSVSEEAVTEASPDVEGATEKVSE